MSTAVMPSSRAYDFGELLLKHPAPGLSGNSTGGSTSNPGSPSSGSSGISSSNASSMMFVRQQNDNSSKMALMRWSEDRETISRRASHPVANSVASLVTTLLLDNLNSHRRLDRSQSDPTKAAALSVNTSRYKTELCRPFEESGSCKYGDKCQFAHGGHELRNLVRHPKYKTELCRTFHTVGFCPYGPRCHFIHNADEARGSCGGIPIKSSRPRLCLPPAPGLGSSADTPSPPSSLGSGSPPPSANTAFSFAPLVPTPTSLSPSQSPPPPPASPETRLPVFNKISGQVVQFTLRIGELIA
ncbi:tis11 zinc finger protein [Lycorma delicatula]|uniref:tis11 zinc finger protein n=1 Tax=Lycorma delicatula TaxID=130591 RepID=UPI003F5185BA